MQGVTLAFVSASYQPYCSGDIATFPPERAEYILGLRSGTGRVAVLHNGELPVSTATPAPKSDPLVSIVFTKNCGQYAAGERAAFPASVSRVYVEGGSFQGSQPRPPVAMYYVEPASSAVNEDHEPRRGPGRPRKEGVVTSADKEG